MKPKKEKRFYIPKLDVSELTIDELYDLVSHIKRITGRDFFLLIGGKKPTDMDIKERK